MSAAPAVPATDALPRSLLRPVVGGYLGLHLVLALVNLLDAEAITRGDRALARYEKAVDVAAGGLPGLGDKLLQHGVPGDYLLHAGLLGVGGQLLVLLAQILAGLLALLCAMRLALRLGADPRTAALAGGLLVLLPGSLMHPHQLVTETFYGAALAGGVYLLVRSLQDARPRALWLGFLCLTFATWLRPQASLLVALAAALFWYWRAAPRLSLALACLLAALLSIGSWVGWRYTQTGAVGLGAADFDLPTNFKLRADRIANIAGIPGWRNYDMHTQSHLRMPPGEFLALVRAHPGAAVRTYLTDAVNLAANPGANAFLGDFLGRFAQDDDRMYWMKYLDREGPLGLLRALAQQPAFLLGLLGFGLLHLLFYGLALLGLVGRRAAAGTARARRLLLAVVVVQLAVCFLSGTVRWTYRAPVEPLLVALVALGLSALLEYGRRRYPSAAVGRSIAAVGAPSGTGSP